MTFNPQLRIPGPTPLPERVVRAMSRPLLDHRGPEFAEVIHEVTAGAKRVFKTGNDLLLLTSSGSGGLESAVANLVSPGDKVVAAVIGNFGERFAEIARRYGCEVVRYEVEWGQPTEPQDLRALLRSHPDAGVVLLTHNETSTSVTNPMADLARVVNEEGRISVVDGVSSISSIPIEVDAWGVDVAVSGSQKGWMSPPGIALVSISKAAWDRQARSTAPRFYFDWTEAQKFSAKGSTPYTPAESVLFAMQEGIRMLEEEGLDNVYARHRRLADATAAGLQAIGFTLLAADGYRSATVTAALPPAGLDDPDSLRKLLREKYGVVIAGGQGKMTGKMIRVGHLGAVAEGDVIQVLWALEQALEEMDIAPAEGRSLAAAGAVMSREAAAVSN